MRSILHFLGRELEALNDETGADASASALVVDVLVLVVPSVVIAMGAALAAYFFV